MSWEEVRTKGVACPCGQGKIEQREYMDDWNQIEYSTPTIVCPICSKKYKVCTEHHDSYKPGRGSWNNYYLIPIDYPEYSGTQEATVYPRKALSLALIGAAKVAGIGMPKKLLGCKTTTVSKPMWMRTDAYPLVRVLFP